ncbi:thiamine phosphate synthase [Kineosporia sp. J2-2]|uniref:Thiamine-phosphate synthase n=1 Tax=Kineosporia corallincola TaxID=2835133 RepID=A0ABS5TEL1_9ACTN|nr:thiamine phosphate synthase [Kineosporia corallincola]MBT0769519.1 thiamine phosphate synthase [Kineosporia corallincola]
MSTPDLSLYLVTDTEAARRAGRDLPGLVADAARGGVTTVQVREKNQPAGVFLRTVTEVAQALPGHVTLLVNDRVDVFLAARSLGVRVHGVHLGQRDLPAACARDLIGPDAVLGLSAATTAQLSAAAASSARVDYVGVGVVRATATKPDAPAPLGIEGMLKRAGQSRLPAVAIGGITVDDTRALRAGMLRDEASRDGAPGDVAPREGRRAGGSLAGVAVVSGICGAADPVAAARAYRSAWQGAA